MILLPAIVVIVTFIGALTVSHASLFLAQRELFAVAQSAANDGVSAIDLDRFQATGEYAIDPSGLETLVESLVGQRKTDLVRVDRIHAEVLSNSSVQVQLTGTVPGALFRGLPSMSYRLTARATANAVERG